MPRLSGRIGVGITGARIPIRIEDPDTGEVLASTVTDPDGSWSVDAPPRKVAVAPRWGGRYILDAGSAWFADTTDTADTTEAPRLSVGARHARRIAALRDSGG